MANQSTAILPNQKVHTDLDAGKLYSFIRLVSLQLISLMFSDHNRAKRAVKRAKTGKTDFKKILPNFTLYLALY